MKKSLKKLKVRYKYSYYMYFTLADFVRVVRRRISCFLMDLFFFRNKKESFSPAFVAGCGHSGTTLLATILSRNEALFPIGKESEIFMPDKSLVGAHQLVCSWESLAKQFGKETFIEKTPKHVLCLKRIFKILPQAKIILITRDGRDVVSSLKKRFDDVGLHFLIDRWIEDNKAVLKWENTPNVYIIKFEDLVKKPENIIKNVCDFIEIPYSKVMINSTFNPYKNVGKGNMEVRSQQVSQPIHDTTGKWKKVLTEEEEDIFWSKAGGLMKKLKYS